MDNLSLLQIFAINIAILIAVITTIVSLIGSFMLAILSANWVERKTHNTSLGAITIVLSIILYVSIIGTIVISILQKTKESGLL